MAVTPDFVIGHDVVERDIAEAERLKARWTSHLETLRKTGNGRMRIDGRWETVDEAAARIQQIIDSHARTIELTSAFLAQTT